jgi:hypothetical protein
MQGVMNNQIKNQIMKIHNIFLLLFPVFGFLLFSCTKVDEPYATVHTLNIKDTTMNWDSYPPVRKVLLEDYTGHKCVNCPDAAVTARSLEEQFGDQLVVMAVHAGFYSRPDKTGEYTLDLRTDAGNAWNNDFAFTSYPNGMVNRTPFNGSRIVDPDKWGVSVGQLLLLSPDFQIMISNSYNPDSRKLATTIYNRFLAPKNGEYSLTVCILEDSIIGTQKNSNLAYGDTTVPDWHNYVFNGVLRGTINGTYGEVMTTTPDPDITYLARYQATLDTSFVVRNCWVVAFVTNNSTKEVLQAEKKKILP